MPRPVFARLAIETNDWTPVQDKLLDIATKTVIATGAGAVSKKVSPLGKHNNPHMDGGKFTDVTSAVSKTATATALGAGMVAGGSDKPEKR